MFFLLNSRFKLKYTFAAVILLLISVQSCKEPKEYRVNSSFSIYLHRFEREAASRGCFFDLKSNGLIIEFANLSNNIAGLTHFEDPIRIEIDKNYWDKISQSSGADEMKEDLIFHELGHGLLNRRHLNSILSNGDWKSMMCGGDKVDKRTWNINYHGLRRDYYINELFDEHTIAPNLCSTDLLIDTVCFNNKVIYNIESFSKWPSGDSLKYITRIVEGRLCFKSKMKQQLSFLWKTQIDFQKDFSLEIKIECPSDNFESQYGLVFGSMLDKTNPLAGQSLEYVTINNKKQMFMGNSAWFSYFTELSRPEILSKGINVLKIFKKDKLLYYFINHKYVYCNEMEANGTLNYVGFVVPPLSLIYIDDLIISQKSALPISTRKQLRILHEETKFFNPILLYRELSPNR